MPETVPNQKLVTIKKAPCDRDNLYAKINIEAIQKAMNNLTNAEFQIWVYFAKNQEAYTFALSPKAAEEWNISRTTFNRTVFKFIEEGYLVADKDGSNHYDFHEIPKEKGTYIPYHSKPKEKDAGINFEDFTF